MSDGEGIFKQITSQLENIFRHMLPGIAVLLMAFAAHPVWFTQWNLHYDNLWDFAILAAVSLVVGNAWYLLHRFSLHQLIDVGSYWWQKRTEKGSLLKYGTWLAGHIEKSYRLQEKLPRLSNHLYIRSAQVIFLFVISEAALVFSVCADASFFHTHPFWIRGFALAGIITAAVQQLLLFKIDVHTANTIDSPAVLAKT